MKLKFRREHSRSKDLEEKTSISPLYIHHSPQCLCNHGNLFLRTFENFLKEKTKHGECINSLKWKQFHSMPANGDALYKVINQIQLEGPNFNHSRQQIDLDVQRTFPDVDYFSHGIGRPVLRRVLLAFAKYNPNLGYVQGMNFIVAVLLWHTSEVQAFWFFVALIEQYKLVDNFSQDLPGLEKHCRVIEHLLKESMPSLYEHLSENGVSMHMIISDWCFVLFMNLIPIEQTGWILNKFFKYGWSFIYKLILEILARLKAKIMDCRNIMEILSAIKPYQSTQEGRKKFIKALENGWERLDWHKLARRAQSRFIDENYVKHI
ncbi:unnamed protein product [Blepharisma stoltei]|uniref:Rab-GAP TBC domain-containing protein n=1 Tax=Blepharisma stoltei TaxID=1481888 RepID=A0AAU9K2W0_9CILI|nr:unnamed protein product [Blepharisma stoltei]